MNKRITEKIKILRAELARAEADLASLTEAASDDLLESIDLEVQDLRRTVQGWRLERATATIEDIRIAMTRIEEQLQKPELGILLLGEYDPEISDEAFDEIERKELRIYLQRADTEQDPEKRTRLLLTAFYLARGLNLMELAASIGFRLGGVDADTGRPLPETEKP